MSAITAATLFSGIGAPEVAMPNWSWLWHAEIEKFPSAVMAARHPQSINLGDVTAHDFTQRAEAIGRPDVLVFGSPCQSFSVAGKRLGLDDPRGNLALVALGIADRLKPRWFVFENVPGLFSSHSGSEQAESDLRDRAERGGGSIGETTDAEEDRDLAVFLSRVQDIGYSGAWGVLDAQYRGVAQRRERVFFVGNPGDWRHSAAILLEPTSLCGDHPPRRQAGQDVTGTLSSRSSAGGGLGTDFDLGGGITLSNCLNAHGGSGRMDAESETLIPIDRGGFFDGPAHPLRAQHNSSHDDSKDTFIVAHALRGEGFDASEDGTGRGTPLVAFQCQGSNVGEMGTLRKGNGNVTGGVPFVAFDTTQITSKTNRSQPEHGDPCHPLAAEGHPPTIAFDCKSSGQNGFGIGEIASTMRAMGHSGSHQIAGGHQAALTQGGVRRLTPRECERLQSFPDDFTLIRYPTHSSRTGHPLKHPRWAADGPRYKACGNSMNVKIIRWILNRIEIFETQIRPLIERAA